MLPNNVLHLIIHVLKHFFLFSEISLNITVSVGMLSLSTIVPQSLQSTKGILSGLLGNYDGNPNNDFTMPNGTRLPFNISEGVVFSYGMTCKLYIGILVLYICKVKQR